jgi:hypothetical protein
VNLIPAPLLPVRPCVRRASPVAQAESALQPAEYAAAVVAEQHQRRAACRIPGSLLPVRPCVRRASPVAQAESALQPAEYAAAVVAEQHQRRAACPIPGSLLPVRPCVRLARPVAQAESLPREESALQPAAYAAEVVGAAEAASQDAAGEPQPAEAVAELRDEAAVQRPAVAAVVLHEAAAPQRAAVAVRAGAEVPRRGGAAAVAVTVQRPAVALPLAAPWVCRPDPLRRPAPAPQPLARSGRAMKRLRIALPSERWWQAARDEGVS